MNLTELNDHISQVRNDLEDKKTHLDALLLLHPSEGMRVRFAIECLEPRLRELERQALRMTKEREAVLSDHGTGPVPMVF